MSKLRILIVGGVAGGASAAARLRRISEDCEIIMLEKGDHISFANCGLPYHIEGTIQQREKLILMTPQKFKDIINVDVRIRNEVLSIDRQAKRVKIYDINQKKQYEETYDKLILSPGAYPFVPPMQGIQDIFSFTLRSINDMDAIIKYIQDKQPSKALVVGGGFIGLEVAEALKVKGLETTIVELAKQVLPPIDPEIAALVHQELISKGIKLILGKSIQGFTKGQGNSINCILNDQTQIQTELILFSIGVRPETKLAKESGLQLGVTQAIKVNEYCQTSDPDIYAIGDAIEHNLIMTNTPGFIPLAGPANRQGRLVADHIYGRKIAYRGTQGTAICKVFDLGVASVGLNEFRLKQMNIQYHSAIFLAMDHANYYPDANQITMKILFGQEGKIYGFQACGKTGTDKRTDVIAVAMRAGMTVFDLQDLELCYAPPYGSAKDPVNIAGFVASNILKGDLKLCQLSEMTNPRPDQLILDVRNQDECQKLGVVPGSINIPLDQLRNRISELPKDKQIIIYCQSGARSWKGYRILMNLGFDVIMWNGGFLTYKVLTTFMNPQ